MTEVAPAHRAIAKYLRETFGGKFSVTRYGQDNGKRDIAIFEAADGPWEGLSSWATIGLSDYEMTFGETKVRAELLGLSETQQREFGNVLASVVFETLDHGPACKPGAMYFNVLPQYQLSRTLSTMLLVPPFSPWGTIEPLGCDDRTVHWLMAIPITDAEAAYAGERGYAALESLLVSRKVDVWDFDRVSVVE